jgi:membrane protein
LAFYTLFAIAPVLLVAIAIAGLFFSPEAVHAELVSQMQSLIGRDGAAVVQTLLDGASRRQSGWVATTLGSITFLLAATGAFLELQAALNTIWRVKPTPGPYLRAYVLDRLRSASVVVAIGFLLLVSLVVSAGLAALNSWLDRRVPGWPVMWEALNILVALFINSVLFSLLFRFLPDVQLEWRDVVTGAVVTSVLFAGGKYLIGLYLGQSAAASSYGAAGSVILLLVWVYYSSQVLLFGAEFTRIYATARAGKPQPEVFAEVDPDAPVEAA